MNCMRFLLLFLLIPLYQNLFGITWLILKKGYHLFSRVLFICGFSQSDSEIVLTAIKCCILFSIVRHY